MNHRDSINSGLEPTLKQACYKFSGKTLSLLPSTKVKTGKICAALLCDTLTFCSPLDGIRLFESQLRRESPISVLTLCGSRSYLWAPLLYKALRLIVQIHPELVWQSWFQAHFPSRITLFTGLMHSEFLTFLPTRCIWKNTFYFYPALELLSLEHLLSYSQTWRSGYLSRPPFHWDVSGPLRAPRWYGDLSSHCLPWMGPRLVFSLGHNKKAQGFVFPASIRMWPLGIMDTNKLCSLLILVGAMCAEKTKDHFCASQLLYLLVDFHVLLLLPQGSSAWTAPARLPISTSPLARCPPALPHVS